MSGSGDAGEIAAGAELYAFAASLSARLQDLIVRTADRAPGAGALDIIVAEQHSGPHTLAEAEKAVAAMPGAFTHRRHTQKGHGFYRLDPSLVAAVRRARADRD